MLRQPLTLAIGLLCLAQLAYTLDNGLARTPPMGWLAWVRFTCETDCDTNPSSCINSQLFMDMADRLVNYGYKAVGYEYVNIDDCWSSKQRDPETQRLVPDPDRFSTDGIRTLARHIHHLGLKLGIYGDCGTTTCAGYPGQIKSNESLEDNYFETDSDTLVEWEVDSFKFDGCYIDPFKAESICPRMTALIKEKQAPARPILVTCEWPFYMLRHNRSSQPDWALAARSCNTWRYFEDVEDSWQTILNIIDFTVPIQETIVKYHGPGHWFDPDQLVIGNFGLSLDQARAQMALWSMWSAPLYMSNDLRQIDPEMADVLKNKDLITVDQDSLGVFAQMVREHEGIQVFVKPVEIIHQGCPTFVIAYLNRNSLGNTQLVSYPLRELLLASYPAIEIAAQRYKNLYENYNPGGPFSAASCKNILSQAMTLDPNSLPADVVKELSIIKTTQIQYKVHNLITGEQLTSVGLNSTLDLEVNPSGVSIVKLSPVVYTTGDNLHILTG